MQPTNATAKFTISPNFMNFTNITNFMNFTNFMNSFLYLCTLKI